MKKFMMLMILLFSLGLEAQAQEKKTPPAKSAQAKGAKAANDAASPKGFRKKEISFEERVIEGLGDRGYESLSQTGNVDPGARDRLYRKRADFDEESQYLLREMEYLK